MPFEYDPAKSAANKDKHGIDFEEAQTVWADGGILHIPARSDREERTLAIGRIESVHWAVVWTWRGDRVRIISARRARKEEVRLYEHS
jgi:uncharacterized DUF497 family protein